MSTSIRVEAVQRALARCLEAHPVVDQVLPRESRPLADLLGELYYRRADSVAVEHIAPDTLAALQRWLEP